MKPYSFIIFAIICNTFILYGQDNFRLESELLTNYSGGNQTKVFSGYIYDNAGNRVEKKAYNGADTTGALMSTVKYIYNSTDQLADEILLAGTDTLSITHYTYSQNGIISIQYSLGRPILIDYFDQLSIL